MTLSVSRSSLPKYSSLAESCPGISQETACYCFPIGPSRRRGEQGKHQEWWKSFSLHGGGGASWSITLGAKVGAEARAHKAMCALTRNSSAPKAPGVPLLPFIGSSLTFYQILLPLVSD